ncbi:MAG: AraC family ligand binding domain-containing protein [Gaiellaceae bacterium]
MEHIHVDDIETLPAPEGLHWKPVRHTLGISAFGINAYAGPAVGDVVVEDHTDDHQELYVVVTGRATFRSGDEEFDAPAGTLVLFAPGEHRVAHAAEAGTTVLAVGAEAARFEPSSWEYNFRAYGLMELGRFDEAHAAIEEGRAQYPERGFEYIRARLAAAEGDADAARELLRVAIEANPDSRDWARGDALLAPLAD